MRKLKPGGDSLCDLGHPATRARHPGAADRRRAWKCIYSRHGRPRWLHLGDAGAIGLADARTLAAEAMLAVAKGKDPAAEREAERGAGPSPSWPPSTLRARQAAATRSWQQADALVRRYACRAGASWRPRRSPAPTSRPCWRGLKRRCWPTKCWPRPRRYSHGRSSRRSARQSLPRVERNATRSRERVLADSEAHGSGRRSTSRPRHRTALKTILLTGQRPGEVSNMRHEHIVDGWWQMPGEPVPALGWPGTKNGESHRVWLPKPVRTIIAELDDTHHRLRVRRARGRPVRGLDARCATSARSWRGARDAARSAPDPRQHHHRARVWPRRHEPGPEPQGGRHRHRSTTGTIRRRETSASWRRWRHASWRWSKGRRTRT